MVAVCTLVGLIYFILLDPWPLIATLTTLGVIYFKVLLNLPSLPVSILAWLGDRSYSMYLLPLPSYVWLKTLPNLVIVQDK